MLDFRLNSLDRITFSKGRKILDATHICKNLTLNGDKWLELDIVWDRVLLWKKGIQLQTCSCITANDHNISEADNGRSACQNTSNNLVISNL